MRKHHLIFFALTIVLGACRNGATISSTDQIVSGIYTADTLAFETQTQTPTPTSTPLPVFTATPTSTPTLVPTLALPTYAPLDNHTSGIWKSSSASSLQVDHTICNNSAYIEDVTIPDGTVLAPGETFVKSWILKNTGYCAWKNSFTLRFYRGDSMSGQETEIDRQTASGNQSKVSIELTAPNSEGTYTGYWILANNYGYPFGTPFFVQIVVKNE